MLHYLKELFGFGKNRELLIEAIQKKAYIIDVRSPQEYRDGHIQQAVNIPLELIAKNIDKIKKMDKPIITCCQTGGRSRRAKNILKRNGLVDVYNGKGWVGLKDLIREVK